MADDTPDVTVNVTGSMAGLKETLEKSASMVDSFSVDQSTVNINDTASKRGKRPEVELPSYQNEEMQFKALRRLREQLTSEWDNLYNMGDEGGEAGDRLTVAIRKINASLKDLVANGLGQAKPSDGKQELELPNIPSLADPDKQKEALQETSDALAKLLEEYDRLGQGGSAVALMLQDRFNFVVQELESMDEAAERAAEKSKGKGRSAKPPPLPKPPPPDATFLDVAKDMLKLSEAAGVSSGQVGTAVKHVDKLSSVLGKSGPLILAGAAAFVGFAAAAYIAGKAIHETIALMHEAVSVAAEMQMTLIGISNVLGGDAKAKLALHEVEIITEGTAIDPQSLLALIPELEAQASGSLMGAGGLKLITTVSASLDPSKVKEFGSAIAGAANTLAATGSVESFRQSLVRMQLISGEASLQLWEMERRGANVHQLWYALQESLYAAADGGDKANESLGGLMRRLSVDISSTWHQMMVAMGKKAVDTIGPAFNGLVNQIETIKPSLIAMAQWAGEMLGRVAQWVSGALAGATEGMATVQNMMMSGDIKEFVRLSFTWGMLGAVNMFVNNLVTGIQIAMDIFLAPFKALINGSFYSMLLNMFSAAGYGLLSVVATIGTVMFDAMRPVLDFVGATFMLIGSKFSGMLMQAAASVALPGEAKDKLWNEGQAKRDMTFDQAKNQTANINSGIGDQGAKIAAELAKQAAFSGADGLKDLMTTIYQAGPMKNMAEGNYWKPDIMGSAMDDLAKQMGDLVDRNKTAPGKGTEEDEEREKVKLKNAFGQSGPKSVVDSLQSVGGGGFAAGTSWEDKMLDETKQQNTHLAKIAGGKTGNLDGAFGAGGGKDGDTTTSLLTSINSTLVSILAAVKASGGGGGSGSLVTVRG